MCISNIIGRKIERERLENVMKSGRPEFVVVYGRRRVGKTFLINEFFNNNYTFKHTGLANKDRLLQLSRFGASLREYGLAEAKLPQNWFEAFDLLKTLIKKSKKKRKVVFIDELPYMDTARSNFVCAIEDFWNNWGATQKDLVLIVCGSATAWITRKIIKNHRGLHNRLTLKLYLHPFTLRETKQHFRALGLNYSDDAIAECYMAMGGIPYYQQMLEPGKNVAQNLDDLFFSRDCKLANEFENLYASLFENSENYVRIVEALCNSEKGLTRDEIIDKTGLSSNGMLTQYLEDLENCDLIRHYPGYGRNVKQSIYQAIDFYTLFYFKFIKTHTRTVAEYWGKLTGKGKYNDWIGYAFEQLCLCHYPQIVKALGINGILAEPYSWRSQRIAGGAQIDLIIKRNDKTINIFEIKYRGEPYRLTSKYVDELRNKVAVFKEENKIPSNISIHLVMITSMGLANPEYDPLVQRHITMTHLFDE